MNQRFTPKAKEALDMTLNFARDMGHTYVGTEHILLGLLSQRDSAACRILKNHGIDLCTMKEMIISTVGTGSASSVSASDMTPMTRKIIEESAYTAARLGHTRIGTEHLLAAIVSEGDCYANKMIRALRASVSDIRNELSQSFGSFSDKRDGGYSHKERQKETIPGCPVLSKYATDLCKKAKEGKLDPMIGREAETSRVIQILSRRTKNNPCLIGEPGVGKTAVVEGLAKRIAELDVPDILRDKMIVVLDISSMIAGAKYRGEFEERMKNVMEEVAKDKRIILFVDEIHTIIGAGGAEGAIDAANIIKPALARGAMQMIGATTVSEYRKYIEKDAALERRFQAVTVSEPSKEETVNILKGLCPVYEEHHRVRISEDAVKAAVELSVRYIGDRYLPDKAIDLIDEAAARLSIRERSPAGEVLVLERELKSAACDKEHAIIGEDFEKAAAIRDRERNITEKLKSARESALEKDAPTVKREDIEEIVTAWTGIPVKKLCDSEGERLLSLEKLLSERVIGQRGAVECVSRAMRRSKAGLRDPHRPVCSFMFIGPTGVGKTHLAKVLCDVTYGDERAMVRLDMSEYMERHSVSKLIGSPPGYLGHDEGGYLTEKVRSKPYCVVLFDEIEKAHRDVFNILLQILDEGELCDSKGRRISFRNALIVITSNVGASGIGPKGPVGFLSECAEAEGAASHIKEALKSTFSPEFLNRIDELVIFQKLREEDMEKITLLMLGPLKERAWEQGIRLSFSDGAVRLLAKRGFDVVYGARPLKREIVRRVEDPFCEALLSGRIKAGDSVVCKEKDESIELEKIKD